MVAATVLLLAGCAGAPAASQTSPPPTETPQPSNTASVQPVLSVPEPLFTVGCDDVLSDGLVSAVLATDAPLRPVGFDWSSDGPAVLAAAQIGALNCVWSNRDPSPAWDSSGGEGHRVVAFQVVPDSAEPWARYLAAYGPSEEPSPYGGNALGPRCVPAIGSCFFQGLVGTSWVDLEVTGVGGAPTTSTPPAGSVVLTTDEMIALVMPVTDAIAASFSAEPAPAERWSAPESTESLPSECSAFLSDEQAEEYTAAGPMAVGSAWDGPKVGMLSYGVAETGALRCHLSMENSDNGVGYFDYLPAGGWGFDVLSERWLVDGSAVSIEPAGLREGDAAIKRCGSDSAACSVDMRIGGNWIQLNLTANVPGSIAYPDGVDIAEVRANVDRFAEAILANLSS